MQSYSVQSHKLQFTSATPVDEQLFERTFALNGIPGILWTPTADPDPGSEPLPLVLIGHPGGVERMYPRLLARARSSVAEQGYAAATIELPGSGGRTPLPDVAQARLELQGAIGRGEAVSADIADRLVLPLVEAAVPEWQATLDALLALPGFGGPVGFSGGVISIGVRLATVEPRVVAAGLFAGSVIPRSIVEAARQVQIPVHMLLQWDDEHNDRQAALDLFDALGSAEKTLQANLGGHTGVPAFAGEDAARFFARHLR